MADIATVWDVASGTGDWALDAPQSLVWTDELGNSIRDELGRPIGAQFFPGQGLLAGQDLYTAVLVSIFTDREAGPDDIIPDGSNDPRGWWAGTIGSWLWLRARSKATPGLPAIIRADIEEALVWLVDDDVVAAVEVTTAYERPNMIGAQIVLRHRSGARAALRFSRLWESV